MNRPLINTVLCVLNTTLTIYCLVKFKWSTSRDPTPDQTHQENLPDPKGSAESKKSPSVEKTVKLKPRPAKKGRVRYIFSGKRKLDTPTLTPMRRKQNRQVPIVMGPYGYPLDYPNCYPKMNRKLHYSKITN